MFHKKMGFVAIVLLLSACGTSKESTKIQPLQKKDKNLSCKEILLEMNEAEFYRDTAHKNRGPKLKNILMPLGYVSTYMDAEEAIQAADARVSYLDKIYNILRCEEKEERLIEMENQTPYYKGSSGMNQINAEPETPYFRGEHSRNEYIEPHAQYASPPGQYFNAPKQYIDNSEEYTYSGVKYYK